MVFFSIKRVLAFAWHIYAHNAPFLTGLLILLVAFAFGNHFITLVMMREESLFVGLAIFSVGWFLSVLFGMGFTYITIRLARRKVMRHEDLLTPAPSLFRYISASILYGLIVSVGLLLFVVPGIIWGTKYFFYRYLFVDQDLDPLQALYISGKMTEGVRLKLLGFFMVLLGINLFGLLLFGLGLLVTVPVTLLAIARVYNRLLCAMERTQPVE